MGSYRLKECAIMNLFLLLVLLVVPQEVWSMLALSILAYAALEIITIWAFRRAFVEGSVREAHGSTVEGKVFVIAHGYPYRWFVRRYIRTRC